MMKDAESHASDDQAKRELIDPRNQPDSLVYSVEKTLTEMKDKLPAEEVEKVQVAVDAAKKATRATTSGPSRALPVTFRKRRAG